jgi:two-component system, response regulator PdtaR
MQDEPLDRLGFVKAIEDADFEVAEAADSNHVASLLEQYSGRVCAIVADINLPASAKIPALARQAATSRREVGLIFTSTRDTSDLWALPKAMRIFEKPYAIDALVQHIRKVSSRANRRPASAPGRARTG